MENYLRTQDPIDIFAYLKVTTLGGGQVIIKGNQTEDFSHEYMIMLKGKINGEGLLTWKPTGIIAQGLNLENSESWTYKTNFALLADASKFESYIYSDKAIFSYNFSGSGAITGSTDYGFKSEVNVYNLPKVIGQNYNNIRQLRDLSNGILLVRFVLLPVILFHKANKRRYCQKLNEVES